MNCSTYLSLPTLESLAHSSSSASSSCSLFDTDPQGSDSQSDSSPPEEDQRSTPINPPLKFLPDYALDAGPKQRRRRRMSDRLGSNDDVGYDSERESPAGKKRDGVRTKRRGAPQCESTEGMGPSGSDISLACVSTPPLICPVKPRLLPLLDAASPSPIFPLPSPVVDLGTCTLESASDYPREGLGLGISLPKAEVQRSTKDPSQRAGGPLSQAIAFASIPFYFGQPRRKKSARGLGLGRPASVDQQRAQVEQDAPRPVFLSCAAGECSPPVNAMHGSPTSPLCTQTRPRMVVGGRRLLKSYRFPKRYLYAIPEVLTPTCHSPIGMCGTRFVNAADHVSKSHA